MRANHMPARQLGGLESIRADAGDGSLDHVRHNGTWFVSKLDGLCEDCGVAVERQLLSCQAPGCCPDPGRRQAELDAPRFVRPLGYGSWWLSTSA